MLFKYDFGDNWEFVVALERIGAPDPKMNDAVIIESHGAAPKQYRSWDEEE